MKVWEITITDKSGKFEVIKVLAKDIGEAIKKAKKWKNKYSPASEITEAEFYCSVDVE